MAKIPVGETIAKSYAFAFKHAPTNFAVSWATLLLPPIAAQIVGHYYPPQFPPPGTDPVTAMRIAFAAPQMLVMVIVFFCIFAQLALFTREALGLRQGSPFLQNPLGAGTWRVILAMLLLVVVSIVIYIAVLVVMIVGAVAFGAVAKFFPDMGAYTKPVLAIALLVLALAVPFAWTYIVLRLTFLVIPVAIAEEQVSLSRAWELARGNVWRIFLLWLSVALPLLVLDFAFFWLMSGGHTFPPFHAGMKPEEIYAWQRQYMTSMQNRSLAMYSYWYITVPVGAVSSTIIYGLFSAPAAFAYRALTPEKPLRADAIAQS